jgi:ribosome-binding protein aMBF1 (putative translation factor)
MDHQDWQSTGWNKKVEASKVKQPHKKPNPLDSDEPPPPPSSIPVDTRIRIQSARLLKKLTQKELAAKLNVSAAIINGYESGKIIPTKADLHRISQTLNVKI